MSSGESVIKMRDKGEGSDLDIFLRGLVRDIILLVGADVCQSWIDWRGREERTYKAESEDTQALVHMHG
jgi:hypothetical protein